MKFQIIKQDVGIVVAEYERESALLPNQFDSSYSGNNYVTIQVGDNSQVNTGTDSFVWTRLEFLRRFTTAERIAIREAAKLNSTIEDFMELLSLAENVYSNDTDVCVTLNLLESAQLLSPGRANQILGIT